MQKSKKRILILSPFFYPELISTGKFNTNIAKELRDKGYNVTILCSHPFYPKWKPIRSNQSIEGIKIIRGGAYLRYPNNIIAKRAILEVWYALFVFKHFFRLKDKIDIIVPVFPPSLGFYILTFLIKNKIKKVGMIHDLQEVYSSKKTGVLSKIIRFFINKVERITFKSCDKLIFLSEEMKETAEKYYDLNENKLEVQYPFINIDTSIVTNELERILSKHKNHVVYSGALGEKQNPNKIYELYDFASKRIENTEFHFFSQGNIFEQLNKKNKNEKIRFHNLVPEKNILELYKRSTIQIIPQKKGTSKGSLPSKLPNIMASGCNILIITDENSELDNLFKKYNLNTVVTLWDNELLCSAINSLLKKNQGRNIHNIKIANELFNSNAMVDKILN
jgi:glycosyltransferase involved in cell wall biosynthesis